MINLNVFEDGEKIGEELVDINDKNDIREKLSNWFEMDDDSEFELLLTGDEVYIGLSELEYMWNKD